MRPSLQLRPREAFAAFRTPHLQGKYSRKNLHVCAGVLTATGPRFQAEDVTVKGTLGEGSYGQVFEVPCGVDCIIIEFESRKFDCIAPFQSYRSLNLFICPRGC